MSGVGLEETSTRDLLIETGVSLMAERGYTAVGVKDITSSADVPKGSFYYYFDSKEAFAGEVVARYASQEGVPLTELIKGDGPALKRLRLYFEHARDRFVEDGLAKGCLLGAMASEMGDHSPAIRNSLTASFASWRNAFATVLREAASEGDLQTEIDTLQLADTLIDGWEGAIIRMKAEKSAAPLDRYIENAFTFILKP